MSSIDIEYANLNSFVFKEAKAELLRHGWVSVARQGDRLGTCIGLACGIGNAPELEALTAEVGARDLEDLYAINDAKSDAEGLQWALTTLDSILRKIEEARGIRGEISTYQDAGF